MALSSSSLQQIKSATVACVASVIFWPLFSSGLLMPVCVGVCVHVGVRVPLVSCVCVCH